MYEYRRRFPVFIIFFLLSLLLLVLSQYGWLNELTGIIQKVTLPIQRYSFTLFHQDDFQELSKIKNENILLRTKLAKLKELEKDNQALRDQFATVNPAPKKLIPAAIVGFQNLWPGDNNKEKIIIDKGSKDKVRVGNSVVFKDNLIGRIVTTSPGMSVVNLVSHVDISFTGQTVHTDAIGINTGDGKGKMVLSKVLSSDRLQIGDMVVAKDPTLLVVGKIVSVNKKASSLFQSAEVEGLVDITKLRTVFVLSQADNL